MQHEGDRFSLYGSGVRISVSLHICMYTYVCVHIFMGACLYAHVHVRVCVLARVLVYACICVLYLHVVCMYVCMFERFAFVVLCYFLHAVCVISPVFHVSAGAGTALPGLLAASCGAASVVLSDDRNNTALLSRCQELCQMNGLILGDTVQVLGLSWGEVSPSLLALRPADVILAADCMYDTKRESRG